MKQGRRWRRPPPRPTDLVYAAVQPGCECVVDAVLVGRLARARLKRELDDWFNRGLFIARIGAREAAHRITRCTHETSAPDLAQLVLV